jgi:Rad3-related DNA helicase
MFLPDPDGGDGGYAVELGRLLAEIFRRTRGRGMGLFTSYDMLARTAAVLRPALDGDGIPLLVQGESGSREAMLDAFRTHGAAVLLGTHSFWEGVDVVGEALSCLVVARLPFAVFTDPIMDARCRQVEAAGDSAFYGFSVPNAVIKLRQGFGRLIRSRADRGLVVIADRRIISKRYGQWFRNSLPVPVRAVPDRDQFLAAVEAFFESGE